MRDIRTTLPCVGLALALAAGTVAAAHAQTVINRGNGDEPETLDIEKSSGVPEYNIQIDLYDGLMMPDAHGKPIPGAAESYTVSKDGLVYTFKLRDEKWSDGTPVTADDFVFAWHRLVDPKTASDYAFFLWPVKNAKAITDGKIKDLDQMGVKALDAHTLQVTLEHPTPYFVSSLIHHSTFPISKANFEKYGPDFVKAGNLVSNGPYMLKEHVPHDHITLVKNPYYWDAKDVKVDQVNYLPISDQSQELQRFQAGSLQISYDVPTAQIPWIRQHLGKQLHTAPYDGTYYYAFNLKHEPWASNPKLREALSLAIDRDIIVSKITQSGETPSYSFVPPGTLNYDVQQPAYAKWTQAQRVAEAKKLYKEAGYGPDKPLNVEFLYNTNNVHKRVAIAVAAMWKQVLGVNTTLSNQEWKVFLQTREKLAWKDLVRQGWIADYNDADDFLNLLRSDAGEQNPAGYANPKYDALMDKAEATLDLKARGKIMEKAEDMMLADFPIIPIYTYASRHLVSSKIHGWDDNIMDLHPTRYMTVSK